MDSLLELLKIIISKKMLRKHSLMPKKYLNIVRIKYPPSGKKLNEILEQNINKLIKKVPTIKKILLFGSYAKEKPHHGSDVDLLIIVSERKKNDFEKIYELLFEISLEYEWSPLLITEERLNELKNEDNEFIRAILRESIVIWLKKTC
ncbi:MAG: hypothetical protein GF317_17365 [Candidatus Lokiarchaeota archaeon]|nr:hypothetical protein [Candidatus Lokiarchaeota archaeon]MBD3201289.1 hypothetical protein [Candidatus Lokiarchaeota archaeon]